jgi:hypothetical protein
MLHEVYYSECPSGSQHWFLLGQNDPIYCLGHLPRKTVCRCCGEERAAEWHIGYVMTEEYMRGWVSQQPVARLA